MSLRFNDLERCNGRYFALFQRIFVCDIAVKQLLGLHRKRGSKILRLFIRN